MEWLNFVLVVCVALIAGQPKAAAPQDLPTDRTVDTYSVYDAALVGAIFDHPDDAMTYFISDHTGQTYDVPDVSKCVQPPKEDQWAFAEAVADFRAQQGKVYRLENYFTLKQRKLLLVAPNDEAVIRKKLSTAQHISNPQLDEATDIIRLSNVGFSHDRSLAIVIVSNYCGNMCGGEKWRIFTRSDNGWAEQQYTCFVWSMLLPPVRRR